ncbi:MAG TPA: zf-HC2 domain-containing protein [Ktedonobacteraceae bacterium]
MSEQQQVGRNNGCLEAGQLMAWLDGALSRQEANEVMAHLASCARCTAEERALRSESHQVFDLLSRLDPLPTTHAGPAAAFAHFQTRLYAAQNTANQPSHANGNIDARTLPLSGTERDASLPASVRPSARSHRPVALVQTLVAALIIAALLGSTLLLLRSRVPSPASNPKQTPSIGPVGTPVKVQSQAGGLEMTMQITPGPYFLSEMLAADLTLTNHSQTTYLLEGTWNNPGVADEYCYPPLKVVITGGDSSRDTGLEHNLNAAISCYGTPGTTQLLPNQTMTIRQYLALTSSGQMTLQVRGTFQKAALGQDGIVHIVPTTGPLDGHWPSLHISVQAQVPAQHLITLHAQPAQVVVDAPPDARGRLLYLSTYDCVDKNSSQHGGGGYWIKLQGLLIEKPQCGYSIMNGTSTYDTFVHWVYVVGAPGYSIVAGTYP